MDPMKAGCWEFSKVGRRDAPQEHMMVCSKEWRLAGDLVSQTADTMAESMVYWMAQRKVAHSVRWKDSLMDVMKAVSKDQQKAEHLAGNSVVKMDAMKAASTVSQTAFLKVSRWVA
jgi:hypothetical protein